MSSKYASSPSNGGSNSLLVTLSSDIVELALHLDSQTYRIGTVLAREGEVATHLYFPEQRSVISLLADLESGNSVEVGVVGSEGIASVGVALGSALETSTLIVQAAGDFSRVSVEKFRALLRASPSAALPVMEFGAKFLFQVSQTAACNRMHTLEERLARWLLMFADKFGSHEQLPLTHEFLSHMLGVRRSGVTVAVGTLSNTGALIHGRNRITIIDPKLLRDCSCECYGTLSEHLASAYPAA